MTTVQLENSCEVGVAPVVLLTTMADQQRILVVDDDPNIRDMLERYLSKQSYTVHTAGDSATMNRLMGAYNFDLVILDLMLAGEDGLILARRIRENSDLPIIMLTVKGDEIDRIIGLEMGADDYLPKPFNPRELLARMKAVLRRAGPEKTRIVKSNQPGEIAHFDGWTLDTAKREVRSAANERVDLSSGEFDLLSAFVGHPRRTLSREQLLDYVHGGKRFPFDRSIDIQIMRLRRKIEIDPQNPLMIKTVHGAGYMFTPKVDWS